MAIANNHAESTVDRHTTHVKQGRNSCTKGKQIKGETMSPITEPSAHNAREHIPFLNRFHLPNMETIGPDNKWDREKG